jgi:HD-like signal output (HDOD) protein
MDFELKKFEQVKAMGELPSPKGVALTIIRLTQRDDVSAAQLENAIKTDPAFVGRLLKAANAAGRNGGRPVVAISDALKVLGMGVVRNLALGFSLISGYRKGACEHFDFDRFWNRSVLTGLA